jgi:hypothetical protein
MGWRLRSSACMPRMGGQPVCGPSRKQELQPGLQARLPDLSHAAGLRAAGHRADALQGRRTGAARRSRRTDGPPRTYFSHHFAGGNAMVPRMAARPDRGGAVSRARRSVFLRRRSQRLLQRLAAYGPPRGRSQQARLAWDACAMCSIWISPPRRPRRPVVGADCGDRRQQRQRSQLPDGFPEGRTAGGGDGVRSCDRRRTADPRFGLEPHVARRRPSRPRT